MIMNNDNKLHYLAYFPKKWNIGNTLTSNKKLKTSKTILKTDIIPNGLTKGRLFYNNGKSAK